MSTRADRIRRRKRYRLSPAGISDVADQLLFIRQRVYERLPIPVAVRLEQAVEMELARRAYEANMQMLDAMIDKHLERPHFIYAQFD